MLSHAVVSWLTRGVSLSFQRNWFSVHSDDVLLPDSLWSPSGNCTIGDDCDPAAYPETSPEATARMTSQDVSTLMSWQRQRDFTVDQAFNADGTVQHSSNNFGVDSLRASLKLDSGSMRFHQPHLLPRLPRLRQGHVGAAVAVRHRQQWCGEVGQREHHLLGDQPQHLVGRMELRPNRLG